VKLPSSYESLTGAGLEDARALVRRNRSGVDVRDLDPVRIEVVVVPVVRGSVPRRYGAPVAGVTVADQDLELAGVMAHRLVSAWSSQRRVRDGWAAVVARRIGGQR
jgi:hypothetical protein